MLLIAHGIVGIFIAIHVALKLRSEIYAFPFLMLNTLLDSHRSGISEIFARDFLIPKCKENYYCVVLPVY